ncbi:hypothetical protein [Cryobacterium adonitolivorans]|uniref:hypothetical protein n=1 Tax=Cryobacterium adonitolivorans TaxID=1259189 RepID=UPI00141BA253|nr:hypothetical protein [Cryobacterium adonitolivorans]
MLNRDVLNRDVLDPDVLGPDEGIQRATDHPCLWFDDTAEEAATLSPFLAKVVAR